MARYIGPKLKKRQRFGLATEGESIRRKNPRTPRQSDYAQRLIQKQKLKFIYGVMEKQMKRYAREAFEGAGETPIELLRRLETRLDNVVYRLGLGKTREHSRQLVSHGHILVDEKKLDIPSYRVMPGQTINVQAKLLRKPRFSEQVELNRKEISVLGFLEYKKDGGRLLSVPSETDLPKDIDMAKVLEFYRRVI